MPAAVSSDSAEDRIATVPNLLSLVRLALLPVFLVELLHGRYLAALVLLVATSVTDFLDGFLARRLHQVSRIGRMLDPIIDRVTVTAVVLGLLVSGVLPIAIVLVVVAREVGLGVLGLVLRRHGMGPPQVSWPGKIGTALLLTAMPVLVAARAFAGLFGPLEALGLGLAILGAVVYWIAGVGYAIRARREIAMGAIAGGPPSVTLVPQRRSGHGR